ncbi:hypothetical protein TNIN_107361 [Trichonephila inaurata madagascariensis]|uniref:Uncharacterized protein n=1 Tax=Trichonephila inaurata madagascariensis TaxID=2747483 RepID=A0A8X7CDD1_9ARAC|nr:hypothetical protein TNIN_107361 [Trichonephila inaurata madagascariensis]
METQGKKLARNQMRRKGSKQADRCLERPHLISERNCLLPEINFEVNVSLQIIITGYRLRASTCFIRLQLYALFRNQILLIGVPLAIYSKLDLFMHGLLEMLNSQLQF